MSAGPEELKKVIEAAEAAGNWPAADAALRALKAHIKPTPQVTARHAQIVFNSGDKPRAATMTRRALRAAPGDPAIILQLAKIYVELGRAEDAEKYFREVLDLEPDHTEAMRRLAKICQVKVDGKDEACALLERVVEKDPKDIMAWLQLGAVYARERSSYDEARQAFAKALELEPESVSAVHNYGLMMTYAGDIEGAEPYLRKATELAPNSDEYAYSMASNYMAQERMEESLAWFERTVELSPKNNGAQVLKSFPLFHLGRYEEAWRQYEHRLTLTEFKDANFDRPRWRGEDVTGQKVLLISEQGMGDNLQFIRYAALTAERAAHVYVMTHKPLERLFSSIPGNVTVTTALPEAKNFDRYCPLMSLPLIFGVNFDDVPNSVPYLHPDPVHAETWRERLSSYPGKRIGICWRGNPNHVNDRFRSSSLEEMAQLFDTPNTTFFSLHKERPEFEKELPSELIDIGSEFGDFADTAAAMQALDLVISVDTSVCHVAGAVGIPTWTMLPRGPDFRWGLSGETTPWYPTMRLFRQTDIGDWQPVYEQMKRDLLAMAVD